MGTEPVKVDSPSRTTFLVVMIRIVAVGKMKDQRLAQLVDEFVRRSRALAPCEVVEVKDATPAREAEAMVRRLGSPTGSGLVVALDEGGEEVTSRQLAELIGRFGQVSFLIGGADGLADLARRRADRTIRLSALTLTHEMARALLVEQIYRGLCIRRNHPYHRG